MSCEGVSPHLYLRLKASDGYYLTTIDQFTNSVCVCGIHAVCDMECVHP